MGNNVDLGLKCSPIEPVLRIHNMLVWIRIRIRGSMLLTNGSGPTIFVTDLQDANKKLIILKKFFCLLLFKGIFK